MDYKDLPLLQKQMIRHMQDLFDMWMEDKKNNPKSKWLITLPEIRDNMEAIMDGSYEPEQDVLEYLANK